MTHSEEYLEQLLARLELQRKQQGITQKKLAEQFEITRSHLNKIINKKTMPSLYVIKKIEEYCYGE